MEDTNPTDAGVDSEFTVTIDGKTYRLDDLTVGEVEELEQLTGQPWTLIDFSSMTVMRRLAFYFLRREDPAFTLEAAADLKLSRFRVEQPEPDTRPTGAADAVPDQQNA